MALNLNPSLKYEASIKTHCLQKAKNHMNYIVSPTTPGGSCNTISSSDVCIAYKITMNPTNFSPAAVSFPTKIAKQDKPPALSPFPQAGAYWFCCYLQSSRASSKQIPYSIDQHSSQYPHHTTSGPSDPIPHGPKSQPISQIWSFH